MLICLAVCVGVAACGNTPSNDDDSEISITEVVKHSTPVSQSVRDGVIPESAVRLGMPVDDAKAALNALAEGGEDAGSDYYSETARGSYKRLFCEGNHFYYDPQNKDNGITAIVFFADSYDFRIGIDLMDVVMASVDMEGTEYTPDGDELFFIPGGQDGKYTAVYYTSGSIRLDLVFYDSFLSAAFLRDTDKFDPASAVKQ